MGCNGWAEPGALSLVKAHPSIRDLCLDLKQPSLSTADNYAKSSLYVHLLSSRHQILLSIRSLRDNSSPGYVSYTPCQHVCTYFSQRQKIETSDNLLCLMYNRVSQTSSSEV